jgi:hypothetical protein
MLVLNSKLTPSKSCSGGGGLTWLSTFIGALHNTSCRFHFAFFADVQEQGSKPRAIAKLRSLLCYPKALCGAAFFLTVSLRMFFCSRRSDPQQHQLK